MDRREPVATAVEKAARLLQTGWGEGLKSEERLRRSIAACALESPNVLQVQIRPEWKPKMRLWPSKVGNPLGGFDLAFRMKGDGGITVAAETKWSTGRKVDALDETPWDVIKLVHVRATVGGVRWALLITAAPTAAFELARYAQMFDENLIETREMLSLNPHMYELDAKSRPLKLPPYVQSSPAFRVGFELAGKPWEIRLASVRTNGEPWLDCDEVGWPLDAGTASLLDWPHPEPGLGMENDDGEVRVSAAWPPAPLPTSQLRAEDLPGPHATWAEIVGFAHRHDGYARHGDGLADLANRSAEDFAREHGIDKTLPVDDLRSCLFFEARRYRHRGHTPGYDASMYVRALVEEIGQAAASAKPTRGEQGEPPSLQP